MTFSTTNLLLLLVGIITPAVFSSSLASASCVPKEREALLAFKQGITSDPNNLLASWEPTGEIDCCNWEGVQCSNWTGHVLELHLGDGGLVGEISHSLLSLHHLEYLNISNNSLQGPTGKIPEFIGSFKSLRYLDLSLISFSGMVPPQLGNLSKLQYLDLTMYTSNHLYSTDLSWLSNLPLMEYLRISSVDLGRVADWPYVVNMLPSLRVLIVDCSLTSADQPLPRLNFTKLEKLHLGSNKFNHPVASCWFWNIISLEYLSLGANSLYGELPHGLGHMVSLQELELSYMGNMLAMTKVNMRNMCNLTVLDLRASLSYGNIAELIERLPHCSTNKLQELDLMSNNITGSLPNSLGHLTSLTNLVLSGMSITGSLPASIGNFTNLTTLELGNNYLSGHIPSEIGKLAALTTLELGGNYLSGHVPSEIGKLAALTRLELQSNDLTGQIPPLPKNLSYFYGSRNSLSGSLPSNFAAPKPYIISLYSNYISGQVPASICELYLYGLDLSNNLFEGELPRCMSKLGMMEYLLLSNNSFSGNFPSSLQSCTSLKFLDLSWNRFSGTLPQWIGSFSSLQLLRLDHNKFYGHIPENITSLQNLYHLNLAANRISGVIPPQLSNLTFMTQMYIVDIYNIEAGFNSMGIELIVNSKRQQLKYHGVAVLELLSIDLSSNYLTGEIPEGITSLDGLVNLNLSRNELIGVIPAKIGAMQYVESLDLSNNRLTREISSSITRLTYLSALDLSNNNLTGTIPSGGQLDTLYTQNPSIYDGNTGLCGRPLPRVCGPLNNNTSDHGDDKQRHEKTLSAQMFFYLGLSTGYVAGLWVIFCVLLFHKAWRIAYFTLFDKYYDKVYVFVVVTWKSFTKKEPKIN